MEEVFEDAEKSQGWEIIPFGEACSRILAKDMPVRITSVTQGD
jgi:hypothetical protein